MICSRPVPVDVSVAHCFKAVGVLTQREPCVCGILHHELSVQVYVFCLGTISPRYCGSFPLRGVVFHKKVVGKPCQVPASVGDSGALFIHEDSLDSLGRPGRLSNETVSLGGSAWNNA